MTEDDTNTKPAADPMAAARASKARKAAEKAEAELKAAEEAAAPADIEEDNPPPISTLKGRPEQVYEGPEVWMRVTPWGHGQISTGGQFGFERHSRGAKFKCSEQGARSLYNKRWAEPIDPALADKFVKQNEAEAHLSERRGAREREVLANGVNANETWSTGADG
jgi:hypothetical protein